jgi:hypothetical protein
MHALNDEDAEDVDVVETGADPHAAAARPTALSAAASLSDFFTLMPPETGQRPRPPGRSHDVGKAERTRSRLTDA